jgi:hypothetical protein
MRFPRRDSALAARTFKSSAAVGQRQHGCNDSLPEFEKY